MKVVMYMAITVNGLIAKENDDTSFVSSCAWDNYIKIVKKFGNIIVGSRTYGIMRKEGDFKEFPGINVVVVSKDKKFDIVDRRHFRAGSPREALEILHIRGFRSALVAGGGHLNAAFMKKGLADELCLDVEPFAMSKGIGLFVGEYFESRLKLLQIRKISQNELQLRYKVLGS